MKNVIEIKHIWDAISNTDSVYPDVKKKFKPIFKERFKDVIESENAILE